jgi:hypothetical protein
MKSNASKRKASNRQTIKRPAAGTEAASSTLARPRPVVVEAGGPGSTEDLLIAGRVMPEGSLA